MITRVCQNESETTAFGKAISEILQYGDFIALDGDLGAGKTFLSQVIIKSLGVTDYVTSPSYTIVNEYGNIYHFDVYRIDDLEEMYEIGYEEYFFSDGICLVEWASMVEELLPEQHYKIKINHGESFGERIISLEGTTAQLESRLEQIK
ncbi:MAG: tRNA (adenosine(37)-N6)-threonylcarbamoyltransferase complex ATPase subunit type 1 TsaE [Clostridia bacterium]|nr:tRNA (adenosine(37)-N6)-threonylcarbamoyltransferase complex ATPase subunit type 1 TsaE [Clostridia bacterium]